MAEELWFRDGTSWRRGHTLYWNDAGTTRRVKEAWYYDGAGWRRVFSAPLGFASVGASAAATNPTDITFVWAVNGGMFGAKVRLEDAGGLPLDTPVDASAGTLVYNGDPFALYQLRLLNGDGTLVELASSILPDTGT